MKHRCVCRINSCRMPTKDCYLHRGDRVMISVELQSDMYEEQEIEAPGFYI